jgi:hypothetical protein
MPELKMSLLRAFEGLLFSREIRFIDRPFVESCLSRGTI